MSLVFAFHEHHDIMVHFTHQHDGGMTSSCSRCICIMLMTSSCSHHHVIVTHVSHDCSHGTGQTDSSCMTGRPLCMTYRP